MTNMERCRRGMGADELCHWCKEAPETVLHVLRDCTETKHLWEGILMVTSAQHFFDLSLKEWVFSNLRRKEWDDWFATLCWLIWRRRNKRLFEQQNVSNENVQNHASAILSSIKRATKRLVGVNLQNTVVTDREASWEPPEEGRAKVNVDGAFTSYSGAGCGGIIRDNAGRFVMAFMHRLENGDHVTAELWAVLLGLKITWDQGLRRVVVETDAKEILELIKTGECQTHHDADTVEEIRLMLQRDWRIELQFVPRNANRVADFLAKEALSAVTGFHPILTSTPELETVLVHDRRLFTDGG